MGVSTSGDFHTVILLGVTAQWFCTVIILQRDPCKIFLSRTMHHINKKFNLWKLGIYRILVIKENLLQNTTDVSWIMWKLQWNWDSHSHWSWQQTFNCPPKSIQYITHTVCYHILNFFRKYHGNETWTPPEMEKEYVSIFLWYFLEFRKVLLRYLQKDWLLFTTFLNCPECLPECCKKLHISYCECYQFWHY